MTKKHCNLVCHEQNKILLHIAGIQLTQGSVVSRLPFIAGQALRNTDSYSSHHVCSMNLKYLDTYTSLLKLVKFDIFSGATKEFYEN